MKSITQRLHRIWPFFAPLKWGFATSALATLVVAATEPLVPELLKQLLDRGFKPGGIPLWLIPIMLIGAFTVRGVATFTSQYMLAWATYRGTEHVRSALFRRLMDAHPDLYTQHTASSLTNTVAYEVQNGAQQLANSGLSLVRDILSVLALTAYLLWMNWQLTLFVTVLFPAVAVVMRVLSRRLHRLTVEGQTATDHMAYAVEENVLAWRIVRMHGAQEHQVKRFEVESLKLRRLALKSAAAAGTMTPLTQVLAAGALSAVVVTALWQAQHGVGSVGSFVSFVTAMLLLIAPIKRLSEVAVPITRGMAALDRALVLIDDAPVEAGGDHGAFEPTHRSAGAISLRGVTVQYGNEQTPALDHIDLDLRAGEMVALVGPSGAGKTTLINLLPRFVQATAGEVRIDGHRLEDWNVSALRRQFALVSQDVVLFNDSLANNVALGLPLDEQKVRDALAGANLSDFVAAQPEGVHMNVGHNGQKLSGGQRQRVAIARAIYKNAPILILDEATSALDSESERLVQSALEHLMKGRTSIVIAHRLSTIERADRVVVLEGGRIAEQGTHSELLAHGGLFARLHALQFRT